MKTQYCTNLLGLHLTLTGYAKGQPTPSRATTGTGCRAAWYWHCAFPPAFLGLGCPQARGRGRWGSGVGLGCPAGLELRVPPGRTPPRRGPAAPRRFPALAAAGSPAWEASRSLFPAGGKATMIRRKEAGRRRGRDTGRRARRREGKGRGTVGKGDSSRRRAWRGYRSPLGTGLRPIPSPALPRDPRLSCSSAGQSRSRRLPWELRLSLFAASPEEPELGSARALSSMYYTCC